MRRGLLPALLALTVLFGLATEAVAQTTPVATVNSLVPDGVTEGSRVHMQVNLNPAAQNSNIFVNGTVSQSGDFLASNIVGSQQFEFPDNGTTIFLGYGPRSVNDTIDEPDGSVTLTINAGTGYTVGTPSSVTVVVKDNDPTVVSLARVGSGAVPAGGKVEFTVMLGRALVTGETIDVPLSIGGTGVITGDWSLAKKSGATNTGVALRDTGTATPKVRFEGAGAQTATLELAVTAGEGKTLAIALGADSDFDDSSLGTNVGGGADPHNTNNRFDVAIPPAPVCASSDLMEKAKRYYVSNASRAPHYGANWFRVLVAFGARVPEQWTRDSRRITPYTAAEARRSARVWSGWAPFVTALECLEVPTAPAAPVVSIAGGAGITEGGTARFTLTATPAPAGTVTVGVYVKHINIGLAGTQDHARSVVIGPDGTGTLEVATVNDLKQWPNGTIRAGLLPGKGYRVGAEPDDAASVRVANDDFPASTPTLSVSDATASESNRDCFSGYWPCMTFTVTLNRAPAAGKHVWFSWRTRESTPVSARGSSHPRDYYHRRGWVRFSPGDPLTKTFRVLLAKDSENEGAETFEFVIENPIGATIADGVGVGTITNSDPMPAAWLSRFGRTVAEQALDGIAGRMAAPRTPGVAGAVAGAALGAGAADVPALPAPSGFAHDAQGFGNIETPAHTLTLGEALRGSHFTATGAEDAGGGSLAVWGRAAQSRFDGREGTFSLDGETTTAMLGADYARGDWLLGLALMQSEGDGGYADRETGPQTCPEGMDATVCEGAVQAGDGDVEASLTAAIPYAALEASERLKLWGALGVGNGEVTLDPAMGGTLQSDLTWRMAAAGARSALLGAPDDDGLALALVSDALWARTSSEKTNDLAASDSDVTRLRLGLEGRWMHPLDGGGHFTPKLEAGMRHDGGDAETGFGVELGGGLAWSAPTLGLSLDIEGRTLLAHGDNDLEDRGFAASLAFDADPSTARGASFSLRQTLGGQAQGGLDALFGADPLDKRTGGEADSRWTAEAAYGLPAFGGRFTASPHAGVGLSTGARDYTLGWRLTPAADTNAPGLTLGVQATRRESTGVAPEHAIGVELGARW